MTDPNASLPAPPPATDWRGFLNSLRRDPEHGWIAGICAGLAQNLGLLPSVVRAGFVVLFFLFSQLLDSGWFVVITYCVLWIGLPAEGRGPALRWPGFGSVHGGTTAPLPTPPPGTAGSTLGGRSAPTAAEVRLRLAALDQRLAAMEDSITSGAFGLHRQFAGLQKAPPATPARPENLAGVSLDKPGQDMGSTLG